MAARTWYYRGSCCFEAGGHNGREETTTFCLIPAVRNATTLPLIAAGGIGTGEGIFAAMVLGAEGVQIGTRFALTDESSASPVFKEYCLGLGEGDTKLLLKKLRHVWYGIISGMLWRGLRMAVLLPKNCELF